MTSKEQVYRAALELIQADRNENNQPARDRADLINVAVLAIRHADRLGGETTESTDHWDRMFGAWVKHQAGLPSDVPLWPNPDWPQDVAMVAHALAQQAKTPAQEESCR